MSYPYQYNNYYHTMYSPRLDQQTQEPVYNPYQNRTGYNQNLNQTGYNRYQSQTAQSQNYTLPTVAEQPPTYTLFPVNGQQQQTPAATISRPVNTKPLAFCKKVHQLNACGHKEYGVTYIYCGSGEHPDTQERNKKCWNDRWQPSNSKKTRAGNDFCKPVCQAAVSGWTCCQCRILVYGKMDSAGVKHRARDGSYHYFCEDHCIVNNYTPPVTQTVGTDQANVNNFNFNLNAANLVGSGSFPSVHFGV